MRNLKKILALVLALVMSMSMLATANAFEDSKDIDADFTEAVEVLNALKVFQGYDNGKTFQPKGAITRAEVAAIIYRIVTGDVKDDQKNIYSDYNQFNDVTSDKWYAGYVNFCANAEIIKGYSATKFGPNDTVTGYQALAMILRAIGYDKNGEFTGTGWQVQTAAVAKKLGITNKIAAGTLGTAATREVVAEILFQTIAFAPQVDYTMAFGYLPIRDNDTLGYETFKLVGSVVDNDQWGRPSNVWKLDKDADRKAEVSDNTLVAIPFAAAASYTTSVDECDIAADLGLTKSAAIEAAYIDGETYKVTNRAITTDLTGTIDPRNTTSYVGAQGRLTEIYEMATGYRIVEINTYLAKVDRVVAEKVDKNGHVAPAHVFITVYANATAGVINSNTSLKFYTDEYAVGDYALVTVSKASLAKSEVATMEYTEPVATGALKGFSAVTTLVGAETYDDADKFTLGYTKSTAAVGNNYDVFVDQYGNIIGLTDAAKNYLVIEAIRWIHDGTLYGGSAIADVVLATGERVQNVTIASVGTNGVTNKGDANGNVATGTVSDYYVNNDQYYNHIASYSVNDDGSYSIGYVDGNDVCAETQANTIRNSGAKAVTITTGLTTIIDGQTNKIVANDNTVFLVRDYVNGAPAYTYTTYVGKNNVPSMKDATICYMTNGAGYAALVVVTEYTLASNSFVAYVPSETTGYYTAAGYAYDVYKLGETEKTTIYDENPNLFAIKDGFYNIVVSHGGNVDNVNTVYFMGAYDDGDATSTAGYSGPFANYNWDRAWVKTDLVGNSLQTTKKDGTTPFADYFVDNAKYLKVEKVTLWTGATVTEISEASAADMIEDTKVIVAWTANAAGAKDAAYIYVIDTDGSAVYPGADKYVVNGVANPYAVTVNNVHVVQPTCYTNTTAGTAADALAGAMANATELSLKSLTAVASNEYTIAFGGAATKNAVVGVYQNAAQVPASITLTGTSVASWTGTLAVGNYVVIADAAAAGTANYYAVYEIVE